MNALKSLSFRVRLILAALLAVLGSVGVLSLAQYQGVDTDTQQNRRRQMVENQLRRRGIKNEVVLAAMGRVPRHRFVPTAMRGLAYSDGPLPIGKGQTISQPYIVALMTELIEPGKRCEFWRSARAPGIRRPCWPSAWARSTRSRSFPSLAEVPPSLLRGARLSQCPVPDRRRLRRLARAGTLSMRSCSPRRLRSESPDPCWISCKIGGRLVAPVGREDQELLVYHPDGDGLHIAR